MVFFKFKISKPCDLKKTDGFTLVEMLVAIAVFTIFIGVILTTYTGIVRAQREANDFREVYVEARDTFDYIINELRDGMVDYQFYGGRLHGSVSELSLISKDGLFRTTFRFKNSGDDEGILFVKRQRLDGAGNVFGDSGSFDEFALNPNFRMDEFKFYVSPAVDPYDQLNFSNDLNQFQPKVSIVASFEDFEGLDLQTSISSRIYNQVYKKEL